MVGGVRRYGGCDSGGGVMGEAPDGTSIYLGTLRVEINQKLGSKLIALRAEINSCVRLRHTYFGGTLRVEIIEELGSKINQKFIFGESLFERER